MSEPNKPPSLLAEALRFELEEIVQGAVERALNGNGHHGGGQLLDAEKAGKRLDVPESWIRDMARQGELPCVHLGHYIRFKAEDLDQFVKAHKK